jgi:hypothetical protein
MECLPRAINIAKNGFAAKSLLGATKTINT